MKKDFIYIGIILLILIVFFKCDFNKTNANPGGTSVDSTKVTLKLPEKKGSFSVKQPRPIVIHNYISENKNYEKLIDKIEKKHKQKADSLTILRELLQATKVRTYKEHFEDSIISANVTTETKGYLKSIDFDYKLKPQKVSFYEKTITKNVKPKFSLLVGGKVNTSYDFEKASFELNLGYQDKKGNIIEFGANTQKHFTIGYKKSIFSKY
ncbi:conserved protein of unknown function [Tenacibaculum sp. 190524A02b]|uniref:hypothetical protein n=1 Tax=Tenacibaculum vairaonense TaxID=3137860 RepID=UPI0032B2896C